jgi:type I restriction enzyme S subunit
LERYVAGEHMDTDELQIKRWGTIGDGYLGPAFHRRFRNGQVLYGSRRTYLRKVAVADFDGICANTTFVCEPADPAVLLPDLLPFVMRSDTFHAHSIAQSKGSVNPYINWPDVAWYEFELPPIDEQREITDLLWGAEFLRRSLGQLSRSADSACRISIDARVQSGVERQLGDVLEMCQYGLSVPLKDHGETPVLRMQNVADGGVVLSDLKYVDLPASELALYRLEDGDILFNRTNSVELVGRTGMYSGDGDAVFASYLIRLRPTECLLPDYLNLFLNSTLGQGRVRARLSKGVSQANISGSSLKLTRIPVPELAEQRALVDKVVELGHTIEALREQELRVAQLQRTLALELLSGG